jgi:hypothetical protein
MAGELDHGSRTGHSMPEEQGVPLSPLPLVEEPKEDCVGYGHFGESLPEDPTKEKTGSVFLSADSA